MAHEYHLLPRLYRWLRHFRQRCGYGVHSPLAFTLITDVIYNDAPYYAYERLRQPLVASISRLDEYDPQSGLTAKDLRLLFRLANYQEAQTLCVSSSSAILHDYLQAARPSAKLQPTAQSDTASPIDFAYYDSPEALIADSTTVTLPLSPSAMVVVRGIHRNTANNDVWQALQAHPDISITFDLGRFGIALRRPKVNRQDYIVNYF